MLISVEELHQVQNSDDVVIIDTRFYLANPTQGYEEYREGHIEGAVYFDLDRDLSGQKQIHGGRHPLPDIDLFVVRLREIGVNQTTTVVVYDSGQGMAARAWWLLRFVGLENVRILNGGLSEWIRHGYSTTTLVPAPKNGTFVPQVQTDWVVAMEDVVDIVSGHKSGILVDARAPERYRGDVEPMDKLAGHIPGALNMPYTEGLTESGLWRAGDEQTQRFCSIPEDADVIMYCGSGVTACNNLFALSLAGRTGKLYAGSWSDWISYTSNPVETNQN